MIKDFDDKLSDGRNIHFIKVTKDGDRRIFFKGYILNKNKKYKDFDVKQENGTYFFSNEKQHKLNLDDRLKVREVLTRY
jgi:hypothetical protein